MPRPARNWRAIKFDDGDVKLIVAIREALHLGSVKKPKKDFLHLTEASLRKILRNRFEDAKKNARKRLIESEQQVAADEEAQEEDVKFYGEFGQYKTRDRGVFVRTIEELPTGETTSPKSGKHLTSVDEPATSFGFRGR
jgi:hypothetical protein